MLSVYYQYGVEINPENHGRDLKIIGSSVMIHGNQVLRLEVKDSVITFTGGLPRLDWSRVTHSILRHSTEQELRRFEIRHSLLRGVTVEGETVALYDCRLEGRQILAYSVSINGGRIQEARVAIQGGVLTLQETVISDAWIQGVTRQTVFDRVSVVDSEIELSAETLTLGLGFYVATRCNIKAEETVRLDWPAETILSAGNGGA